MAEILLKINGKIHKVDGRFGPDVTLNEYIRTVADLRGTKAMCHEGGCGACVVAAKIPLPPTNEVKTLAINSCLVSILSCHNWEIITIEGIGNRTIGYHEIQKRLAQFNGTQCGYCSPGFVMNMYSLYESKNGKVTSVEVENSFASNTCRCTGYRPIADAFKSFAVDANEKLLKQIIDLEDLDHLKSCRVNCKHKHGTNNSLDSENDFSWCLINKMENKMLIMDKGSQKWFKANTLEDIFKILESNANDYKLVAGNTGQGVYHVTDYPSNIIDIFNVSELKEYYVDINLVLGSGITLSEMMEIFLKISNDNKDFSYLEEFYQHMDLVAHIPVRNIGTIGGNLMLKHINNEFQSDLFLMFETVGGMMTIAENIGSNKIISIPEFLEIDMKGKIILNILLPPLSQCCSVKTFKVMPRSQNSHAIVNAGILFKFHHNSHLLEKATLVYGGISRNFIHAEKTEATLIGKDPYTNETLQSTLKSIMEELQPEENLPEPTPAFRKMLAAALYYKAILNLCPDDKINPKYRSGGHVIKRETSKGTQTFETDQSIWPLNQPVHKLDALVQCAGEAIFSNDLPSQTDEVFAAFVTADSYPGSVISGFDTTEAFNIPGVLSFYSAKDIPGNNTFTPTNIPFMSAEEEILCSGKVKFYGQPAGIITADREKTAQKAANHVKVIYSLIQSNKPMLTIDDVLSSSEKKSRVMTNKIIEPTETGNDVKHIVRGELKIKSQYHYYMEPQTCVVRPTEDGMEVYSSSQWLDLTNVAIAQCLNISANKINVIVRRVGGGYGGKISRSCQIACAAALVSHLLGKPCRFILPMMTNMRSIGKRVPTNCNFEVGVNDEGIIQYLKNTFYQDCGHVFNEIISPTTIEHFRSCYETKRWQIEANSVITDNASNTWCRAPSSTEGIAMIENIMEYIAFTIGKDPIQVRLSNMKIENNAIPSLIEQFKIDTEYETRQEDIKTFNNQNRWRKKALKMIPITFEIFYFGNYNSIVSIYHGDGSVVINHGGIEMGQGLNTKVAQVCAFMLNIPLEMVSVKASSSFISPNAMTTGGSIGSECVSFATMKACKILLERLAPVKETGTYSWEELITKAYQEGIDLQASYMYSGKDNLRPYDVYAICALEIEIDILTGNHDIKRVDILEDTGRSLSPMIDVAQIEGGFVMGLGYWTSENLVYDQSTGELLTDRTWTYKPPGIKDIPADIRIYFRRNGKNESGVLQSKATGEPAFCLATVILHAIREAIREARLDAGYADQWVEIDVPCTVENIFMAIGHKIEHFILM